MFIFTSRTKDLLEETIDIFTEEQVGVRAGYAKHDHISTVHAIVQNVLRKIESDM